MILSHICLGFGPGLMSSRQASLEEQNVTRAFGVRDVKTKASVMLLHCRVQ
jgi:hypothetical protein